MNKRELLSDAMDHINKDMVDDALQYERRKRTFSPMSIVIAAAVLLITAMPATILIAPFFMHGGSSGAATVPDYDTEADITADDTTAITSEAGETTDGTETQADQPIENYVRPVDYVPEPGAPVVIDMSRFHMDVMYGYYCKSVSEYTIRYNTPRYTNTQGEFLHGEHLKVMITHTAGIELLVPEIFTVDYSGEPVNIKLKFRYIDGTTKGSFKLFFIEDVNAELDDYNSIAELDSLENNTDFRKISQMLECSTVRTKGYDFFKAYCYTTTPLYYSVAVHFNDVDADGKPLYLNDPYMQDYYDCEQCIEKREKIEQEENNKKYHYGFAADLYESDKTGRISLTKEDYGRNKWLTKLFRAG